MVCNGAESDSVSCLVIKEQSIACLCTHTHGLNNIGCECNNLNNDYALMQIILRIKKSIYMRRKSFSWFHGSLSEWFLKMFSLLDIYDYTSNYVLINCVNFFQLIHIKDRYLILKFGIFGLMRVSLWKSLNLWVKKEWYRKKKMWYGLRFSSTYTHVHT